MKAEMYKVKVCDNALDMVHGFYREVEEYYIPELQVAINYEDENHGVNCFITAKDRYEKAKKNGETQVPKKVVDSIKKYIDAKKELEVIKEWVNFDKD